MQYNHFLRILALCACPLLAWPVACAKSGDESQAPETEETASGAWGPANANPQVINILPLAFDPSADVPGKVVEECHLQTKLPEFTQAYAEGGQVNLAKEEAGAGQVLKIRVVQMMGASGGLFTGPKQLKVEGELRNGDTVVANFRAQRTTTGGAFGAYKGTCSLLGRTAKAIGKDIAVWLQNPTKDAKLGELQ